MRKFGGKFHRKLNISSSPIANKYHEGKVKSTLKRELNVPEIVVNQAIGINVVKELESNLVSLDPLKTSETAGLAVYTEVTAFVLAVRISLDRSGFLSSLFSVVLSA